MNHLELSSTLKNTEKRFLGRNNGLAGVKAFRYQNGTLVIYITLHSIKLNALNNRISRGCVSLSFPSGSHIFYLKQAQKSEQPYLISDINAAYASIEKRLGIL